METLSPWLAGRDFTVASCNSLLWQCSLSSRTKFSILWHRRRTKCTNLWPKWRKRSILSSKDYHMRGRAMVNILITIFGTLHKTFLKITSDSQHGLDSRIRHSGRYYHRSWSKNSWRRCSKSRSGGWSTSFMTSKRKVAATEHLMTSLYQLWYPLIRPYMQWAVKLFRKDNLSKMYTL